MIIITIFFLIVMLGTSLIKDHNYYNPLNIFLFIWLFICVLASFRLFGMMEYSYKGPLIILIGCFGFFTGFNIAKRYRVKGIKKIPFISIDKNYQYEIRENVFTIMLLISIVVYLIMASAVIGLLVKGFDPSTIREMYRDSGETAISGAASSLIYGSKSLKQLASYFARPVIIASIPLCSIDIIDKRRISRNTLLSIIATALFLISTFGRNTLLVIVVTIVSVFGIRKKRLSKKTKKRIRWICIACVLVLAIAFYYLSQSRASGSNSNGLQNAYAYFAIPVPLLDYWANIVNESDYFSFGFSYISGFVANIMNVLARFGMKPTPYRVAEYFNYNQVDHFIYVFSNYKYNAYVSLFFAFYLDFREFGVLIGSFVFGYIISRVYNKATNNNAYLAYYLLLLQSILWSFVRWEFVIVAYCFSFIFLRVLLKKGSKLHDV